MIKMYKLIDVINIAQVVLLCCVSVKNIVKNQVPNDKKKRRKSATRKYLIKTIGFVVSTAMYEGNVKFFCFVLSNNEP